MKSVHVLGLVLMASALIDTGGAAFTQGKPAADPLPPVQAPPSMNDPGVKQAAPAAQAPAAPATKPAEQAQEQSTLPPEVQAAANVAELPVVTVRQNGNETVEEYRKKGKLLFVRVLEKQGPTKFYVDNPAVIPPSIMQQLSGPSGTVQPVYYKLADWK
jgi:hypothetical protein